MIKIKENIAYWCPTRESAEKFMELCKKQKIVWCNDEKCNSKKTNWETYKTNTTYILEKPDDYGFYGILYCYKDYYKTKNIKIVNFENILKKEKNKKKNKMEFKVGNRVKAKSNYFKEYGKIGTIICVNHSDCVVKFDENICGWGLDGKCSYAYVEYKNLELVKPQTIVIKTDGKTTTAYMGDKQAKAICNDTDEFSLEIGSKLALERLFKKDFIPYLEYKFSEKVGCIGKKADFNAIYGEQLFVGDVVELYNSTHNKKANLHYVCYDNVCGYFIMNVADDVFKNGVSKNGLVIKKVKSYKDLKNGEEYDSIKAVLKQ